MIRPILAIAILAIPFLAQSQSGWPPASGHPTMNIWPSDPPDPVPTTGPEADTTTAKDNLIAGKPVIRLGNVSTPTITLYTPKGTNSGAAVVVFPGGGYSILAIDLEGTEVCDWLNGIGVNCILLKYRVPNTGPYLAKSPAALEDAQRAVGLVRQNASSRAAGWERIDPNRIGVLGFSAGGHLAAALSTHYDNRLYPPIDVADARSCRPDFAMIVYPGYLADADHSYLDKLDLHPTANTPPTFLIQAEDDGAHVENATTWFLALKAVKVPAELHLYAQGGHGYGLRLQPDLPVTTWPQSAATWLKTIHILPAN
jgi:acetyl esterase/lipase